MKKNEAPIYRLTIYAFGEALDLCGSKADMQAVFDEFHSGSVVPGGRIVIKGYQYSAGPSGPITRTVAISVSAEDIQGMKLEEEPWDGPSET